MTKSSSFWIAVIVVAILALLGIAWVTTPVPKTVADPSTLLGMSVATTTPWAVELDHLKDRLDAMGLPALTAEGTVMHIHQHLDLFINGTKVDVPAGIGINEAAQFISTIHVHDGTGIIHVESPTVNDFTLGQFFDIWGVTFSKDQIGGYKAVGDAKLSVYVNGAEYTDDPRMLVLKPHQEIAISYGTSAQVPNPIPASFTFPEGY